MVLDPEKEYEYMIKIHDGKGTSFSNIYTIPTKSMVMDFKQDKKGVAIGKPSNRQGFDVDMNTFFNKEVYIRGKTLLDAIYPIGSIYISLKNDNPSRTLGGKWKRCAYGRFLMGVDETKEPYKTSRLTGGEYEHRLTIAEMPGHNHDSLRWSGNRDLVTLNGRRT